MTNLEEKKNHCFSLLSATFKAPKTNAFLIASQIQQAAKFL